jgi:hypothetical protein
MTTKNNFIYGIMIDGIFYSNRMKIRLEHPNGIYGMDMSKDDFKASIDSCDIDDAIKFFRKASKIKVFRGISFHDGIIPENPIAFQSIPIKVKDATFDEFEEIEVAVPQDGPCYFLRIVSTEKAFPMLEVKDALDTKVDINTIKSVTPEIRIVYTFHFLEREMQRIEEENRKKLELQIKLKQQFEQEMKEPSNYIRKVMSDSGATVSSVKKVNRGFEVIWSAMGHTIHTLLSKSYNVIEAGFCTSGHDTTQSVSSVAKLLQDYVSEGSYIHRTRM